MFTKKLFPVANSGKDWRAVSKSLDIAFAIIDNLEGLDFCSDDYDFERYETNLGKLTNLIDKARTIANTYQ